MRAPDGRETSVRTGRGFGYAASLLLAALCLTVSVGSRARAEGDTDGVPVAASVAAGAAVAFSALAIGGAELALHDSHAARKPGAYTLLYGLAFAPLLSHALALEWDRAAIFTAVPLVAAVGATWLIETSPNLLVEGNLNKRRVLTLCYSVALLGAAFGLYDSMHASGRARERRLSFAPVIMRDQIGIVLGGRL